MSAGSISQAGRTAAQSLMTLTLTAYSPSMIIDSEGIKVPGFTLEGTTVGKVQAPPRAARNTPTRTFVVAGVHRPVLDAGLHIPLSSFCSDDGTLRIKPGDKGVGWEFEITGIGRYDDPGLSGRRFLIVGVPAKSFATARRLTMVEVS